VSQTPAQAGPFAQHPRLSEVVNGLRFERYPLFLSGLVYKEPGGPLRRAIVVATRSGDRVGCAVCAIFRDGGVFSTSGLCADVR
jgi:hypothetical protein